MSTQTRSRVKELAKLYEKEEIVQAEMAERRKSIREEELKLMHLQDEIDKRELVLEGAAGNDTHDG